MEMTFGAFASGSTLPLMTLKVQLSKERE